MISIQFKGLIPLVFMAANLSSCLYSTPDEKVQTSSKNHGFSQIHLQLSPGALTRGEYTSRINADSVHIRITGQDMAPQEFRYGADSLLFDLMNLPAGPNRVINADLLKEGRLLYSGRGTFTLRRENRLEAALTCLPQFSRVHTQFHLPMGLPLPVTSGSLKLIGKSGEFKASLKKQGEFGSFLIEELAGDQSYDVSLALLDSGGKVSYEANRASVYLPLGEEVKWDISLLPTEAQAGLALTLVAPKEAHLFFGFPAAFRRPKIQGEIVISEFFAAPAERDSSTTGEWFELFNRTADTLNLSGCRLSRDGGEGITRSLKFDSSQILIPGTALVFGRSAAKAQVHYEDFTLVNTSAIIRLLCREDGLVLDSIRYSSANNDSLPFAQRPVQIKEGWVSSLNADSLGRGQSGQSWCLTQVVPSSLGENGGGSLVDANPVWSSLYATPGRIARCPK